MTEGKRASEHCVDRQVDICALTAAVEGCLACGDDGLLVELRGGGIVFETKDGSFSISSDSARRLAEFMKTLAAAAEAEKFTGPPEPQSAQLAGIAK